MKKSMDSGKDKKEKSLLFKLWENTFSKSSEETEESEPEKSAENAKPEEEPVQTAVDVSDEDKGETLQKYHKFSDVMKVRPTEINYLDKLWRGVYQNEKDEDTTAYYSNFTLDGEEPPQDQKDFLTNLQDEAVLLCEMRTELKEAAKEEGGQEEPEKKERAEIKINDAALYTGFRIYVKLSYDRMEAWIFVFPPDAGNPDVTEAAIRESLDKNHVTAGLDEEMIRSIVENKMYMKLIPVAKGMLPVDGKDGYVEDLFSREHQIRLEEGAQKTVNFRDLNWLQHVDEGQTICKIFPPSPSENGMRVTGEVYLAKTGKNAMVPMGKNTKLNEDQSELVAAITGNLSFGGGKFHVDSLLKIDGDVDFSVGNIDTTGDLHIKGDVLGGFVLKASGDIVVNGVVGNATLEAGGSIQLNMGINGSGGGSLTAGENIRCSYMENCNAKAGISVYAKSIVNCDIVANEGVYASGGQGCIIGGNIIAFKEINAKRIGNTQNRQTNLTLGSTPDILIQKEKLMDQLKKTGQHISNMNKDIAFLKRKPDLTEVQKAQVKEMEINLSEKKVEKLRLMKELQQMGGENDFCPDCHVVVSTIYPPAKVTIGASTVLIDDVKNMCVITYKDGEISLN